MKNYWDKKNDWLFTLSNHAVPDEIGAQVRAVKESDPHIDETLAYIKALIYVFFENQKISFANII